jgi:hypothetical protein
MDNFNKLPKMQCFKEGGSVQKKIANYEKRERKSEEKSDMVQDKAIVKKAIGMHDKQEHPGEKTDLSKLRKGGRAKKEKGTVKKFEKASGEYGAKKTSADLKNIKEAKQFKPAKMCGGKSVKKMADGGEVMSDPNDIGGGALRAIGKVPLVGGALQKGATRLRDNVMGTPEQNRLARTQLERMAARKAAEKAALLSGQDGAAALTQGALAGGRLTDADMQMAEQAKAMPAPAAPMPAPAAPMPAPAAPMPMGQKRGGKAGKGCK